MGINNSRVTKPSYALWCHKPSYYKEFFFQFFESVTQCEKKINIVLELVTRDF